MSIDTVTVQPMYSRSAMSLEEIRDTMAQWPPKFDDLTGGWASMNNHQSNLGLIGLAPPSSAPVIEAATDDLPEMLKARFYYWQPPPAGIKDREDYDPHATRRLAAIDVIITEVNSEHIGILLSTRSRQLLNQRGGVVASLQDVLQRGDNSIRIDRQKSHLELQATDIFLWLTVQRRDKPLIAPDLRLDTVSGISGRDASSRTADLRAGVDFDRPNFLTAVAEADTLGPIDLSFVQYIGQDTRSFRAKVFVDGGFEIHKSELHFPTILDGEDLMVEATLILAYSLIPRINNLYVADADWVDRRMEVIESAMDDLAQRYQNAKAALRERLRSSPQPLEDSDETDDEAV